MWLDHLNADPIPTLLAWDDPALQRQTRFDLLGKGESDYQDLWSLPDAEKLVGKQQVDGSWKYPGKTIAADMGEDYFLLETYRRLGQLVETYRFDDRHPAITRAADFIFSRQTKEGDIRGILGNQYMPYYHGAILELLIKAGLASDPRVIRGLDWLLACRQQDGGWVVPTQQVPSKQRTSAFWLGPAYSPDRSRPHAHLATGMALRALAAHPDYRTRPDTREAGQALKNRFFKPDEYNDRKAKAYWYKFQFPFWWSNLLTALDTLSFLGIDRQDENIRAGLDWFVENQEADGLWPIGYGSGGKIEIARHWVGLAVCRMLSRWYSG